MPRKTSTTGTPTFATEKPALSKKAVCKLKLEKTDVVDVATTIADLVKKAGESGVEISAMRGTLTCY